MTEQRTPEWYADRLGHVTASKVASVIATTKGGSVSAMRRNYMAQIVVERMTGVPTESYVSAEMQRGTDLEPLARAAYEMHAHEMVDQCGFIKHPTIEYSGASPDGLIASDGLLEIKCPNTATHIEYLMGQRVPEEYKPQMGWQLACTGREWCDFVSYDDRMPEGLDLFVVRFFPGDGYIQRLEDAVCTFMGEVESTIAFLSRFKQAA